MGSYRLKNGGQEMSESLTVSNELTESRMSLTPIEKTNLVELETTITKNLNAFYEIGFALMQIKENRLYREQYTTFEAYCKAKWNFAANYARRLIASSRVVDNIKSVPTGTIPQSERTIRPLASLPPDQQPKAYQKAVETAPDGKVTTRHVEETVRGLKEEKPERKKVDLLKNIRPEPEIMGDEFVEAYGAMRKALVNAKGMDWKTTSREVAEKYIYVLLKMTEE
jgi:hypothetical protein